MKTGAAFAKGLLELEGEIPPILVSLVHKEKGSMHMLDPSRDKDENLELDKWKEKITANLQQGIYCQCIAHSCQLWWSSHSFAKLRMIYETMGSLIQQLYVLLEVAMK